MEDRIIKDKYNVKLLSEKDINELQNLCVECSDYTQLIYEEEVKPDAGERILLDLPPRKNKKDKFVFGIFHGQNLIGVLDLIKDFEEKDNWFIGLLMLNPKYRKLGIGKALNECVKEWVIDENGKNISLGVFKQNDDAYNFWKSLGYKVVEEKNKMVGDKERVLLIMEQSLEN